MMIDKAGYSDSEPRDDHGRWTSGGASGGGQGQSSGGQKPQLPKTAPVKAPSNQKEILSGVWRRANENDLNDAMREGAKNDIRQHIQGVDDKILDQFDAHGVSTLQGLTNLLNGGIDPSREFYSETLGKHTGSGSLLRDNGAFVVISHPGQTLKQGGIPAVSVSGHYADSIKDLQSAFPGVKFFAAKDAGTVLPNVSSAAGNVGPVNYTANQPAKMQMVHGRRDELSSKLAEGRLGQGQSSTSPSSIREVYDNFKDIDYNQIGDRVKESLGGLKPEQIKQAYKQAFGHEPLSNSGSGIVKEIIQRITERKESWDRIQFRSDSGLFIDKSLLTPEGLAILGIMELAGYNPNQARGPDGRWIGGASFEGMKTKPHERKTRQPKSEMKPKTHPEKKTESSDVKGEKPQSKQSPEAPKMQMVHNKRQELSKKLESGRLNPDKAGATGPLRGKQSVDKAMELFKGAKEAHLGKGKIEEGDKATLDQKRQKAINDYADHLKSMSPDDLKEFTKQTGLRGKTAETLAKEAYIAAQDRSRWQQECRKNGISVAHFKAESKNIRDMHNETVNHYNQMIDSAGGDGYRAKVTALHNRGGDYASLPGFDEKAERMAQDFPEYFGGGINYEGATHETSGATADHEQKLFDYLVAGKQKHMSKEESFSLAFDKLMGMKEQGQYQRVKKRQSKVWVPWENEAF